MADLGVVGQDGGREVGNYLGRSQVQSEYAKVFVCASITVDPLFVNYYAGPDVTNPRMRQGRDNTDGNPSPPSQIQSRPGFYATLVPVRPGLNVISIDVKISDPGNVDADFNSATQTPPFPRLTVKANPDVGLLSDRIADAVASHLWQTLTIPFIVTMPGVVQVLREKRFYGMDDSVRWDNFVIRRT